jgi:hypothetical protein
MTRKAAKLGGGVTGGNFETARHRWLLNGQTPSCPLVRDTAEESDLQQWVKIYGR